MSTRGWWREVSQVFLVYLIALLVGWFSDQLIPLLLLASAGVVCHWLWQLRRAANWLQRPDSEPPEAPGIWGEFFDSVYHLQRQDREERDRLQTAVSYLRNSFAALKDATVLLDPSANIEWCNSAAEELLGLEYPRDRGQSVLNLVRAPEFHAYFDGADYQQPLRMDGPQGGGARVQVEITPFGGGSRLLFARDITREERMEEMRRDFIANVSHELRTPLTVIVGYLHTLLDSGLAETEELRAPLKHMRQQARRMETLLKDLLWLSRLESVGEEEAPHTPLDVSELMRDVQLEALGVEPEREITVLAETEARLAGNYKHVHSALSNLVMNALKYSDGPITIRWREEPDRLCLEVTDQGPGIDSVHIPRLTERFYRVEKSRAQRSGGTGLGLAIVKHVLAGHSGHLEVDSRLGEGSTFRCVFPLS